MAQQSRLAVELSKGADHVNIWVDANNNGLRDDDDVNIFVTQSGGIYAESNSLKSALDAHLKEKLKEASVALMQAYPANDPVKEEEICSLALEMVVRATREMHAQEDQHATPAAVDETIPAYYPTIS